MQRVKHVHEVVDGRLGRVDRLIVRQPFGSSARHAHHAERDDKRHHAQTGDDQAVEQPDPGADGDGQRDGGGGGAAFHERGGPDHAGQSHHRAHAQINPGADDDHRHSQRADGHDYSLQQDYLAIDPGEKMGAHDRVQREQADNQDQSEHRTNRIEQPADAAAIKSDMAAHAVAQFEAASGWPMAAAIKVCSFHSAVGRTADSTPRHITPMVSHTLSSSGR